MGDVTDINEPDELALWIEECVKSDISDSREWRKSAEENYDFFASRQWDDDTESKMEESGRICVVFNRVARTINAVTGLERQNRQEVRYYPREQGDVQVNEVLTSAAKWVRDNCDAEDEESEGFEDTLICGMGWTETSLDYDTDQEGSVRIGRVDPLEMGWDMSAKKRNIDDAKRVWRHKRIPAKEFNSTWPDHTPVKWSIEGDLNRQAPHDSSAAKEYRNDQSPTVNEKDLVSVVQFQWCEAEKYRLVQMPDGSLQNVKEEAFEKLREHIEASGLRHVKRQRKVYKQAFVNGPNVLEEGPAPCKSGFSFRCITGMRDRNKNTWFGLVELMKDPQRYANKWLSQIVYILSTNSKGGLLAEKDAFDNVRKAEDQWSSPDAITWLKPGGLNKIQEKTMSQYPQGLDRILQYAMEAINDVPGVNQELMGLAGRDQAGYLEAQRKTAGLTMLAVFFDSLRRYRKEQGRVLAYFIQEYISDGRLIRVLGNDGNEKYVPLVRDQNTFQYDVIVDEAATSPNQKERVFGVLSALLPQLLQAGIPVPPEILDYAPLPSGLVQKWKQQFEPNPQEQQKKQTIEQLGLAKAQAEIQETSASAYQKQTAGDLNLAKAGSEKTNQMTDLVEVATGGRAKIP